MSKYEDSIVEFRKAMAAEYRRIYGTNSNRIIKSFIKTPLNCEKTVVKKVMKRSKRLKHKNHSSVYGWTRLLDGSWKCQGCNFVYKSGDLT